MLSSFRDSLSRLQSSAVQVLEFAADTDVEMACVRLIFCRGHNAPSRLLAPRQRWEAADQQF
jgi:hypothetical protein